MILERKRWFVFVDFIVFGYIRGFTSLVILFSGTEGLWILTSVMKFRAITFTSSNPICWWHNNCIVQWVVISSLGWLIIYKYYLILVTGSARMPNIKGKSSIASIKWDQRLSSANIDTTNNGSWRYQRKGKSISS